MEENVENGDNVVTVQLAESIINCEPVNQIHTDRQVKTDKEIQDKVESDHQQKEEKISRKQIVDTKVVKQVKKEKKNEQKKDDSKKKEENNNERQVINGKEQQKKEEKKHKRIGSDDSEFQNWNASVVKDGMFQFQDVKESLKDSSKSTKNNTSLKKNNSIQVTSMQQVKKKSQTIMEKSTLKESRSPLEKSDLKVSRTLGSHKKQILVKQRQELPRYLIFLKPLHSIFVHFCKQNNLSAIKSTLFEDKPKVMEQMNLHKWMVFCKQFQIIDKLYQLRTQDKSIILSLNKESLEMQQIKVKELKEVQKILINIFKAVNQNKAKISYGRFVEAICLIYDEFKDVYPLHQEGSQKFIHQILYCSSQKECYKKLSSLKFTHVTPQISYDKTSMPDMKNLQTKSRLQLQKMNSKQNISKTQNSRGNTHHSMQKLRLNPVLSQAKNTMKGLNKNQGYSSKQQQLKRHKLKLNNNTQRDENGLRKKMVKYFQSSKDEILDTFFQIQKKQINFPSVN